MIVKHLTGGILTSQKIILLLAGIVMTIALPVKAEDTVSLKKPEDKEPSGQDFQSPTSLIETDAFHAQRQGRFFRVELLKPHRVISTDTGQTDQTRYLVNHQSMEAAGDMDNFNRQINLGKSGYKDWVAERLGIDAKDMVLMGTAAQPGKLAWHSEHFNDLSVTAFVTAGVKGNAMRAGEPTQWQQTPEGNQPIADSLAKISTTNTDYFGTINITVLINQPVHQGAMVKLMILATEAKSAALSQLAVASTFGSHLATGTGTDQLILASVLDANRFQRDSGSGHLKLGELTATSVRKAVTKALAWQNQLTPEKTGNLLYALGRFGLTEAQFKQGVSKQLSKKQAALFEANWWSVNQSPRVVAASYAYGQVLDRIRYGTISADAAPEILRDLAVQFSVAVSERPEHWPDYWQQVPTPTLDQLDTSDENFTVHMHLIMDAIALGWSDKWPE